MLASSSSPRYTDRLRKPRMSSDHARDAAQLQTPKAAAANKSVVQVTKTKKMRSIVKVTTLKKNPLFIKAGMVVCWLRTALSLLPPSPSSPSPSPVLALPPPSEDVAEGGCSVLTRALCPCFVD